MAPTNLATAIAQHIVFPINQEWSDDYAETIDLIVELYTKASKSKRSIFKDDIPSFIETYEVFHGSDDDTDYIQPLYCYIENTDIVKAVGSIPGPSMSIARKEVMKEIFRNLSAKKPYEFSLTDLKIFEGVPEAWTDVSSAALSSGIKKAYQLGKINLQWKDLIDEMKPSALTWEALDFVVDVLDNLG